VLYNSFEFLLVFLPASLLLYFGAAAVSRGLANAVLCGLSLGFYAWWDLYRGRAAGLAWWDWHNWHNVFVLAGSIPLNFAAGAMIRRRASKPALVFGIAVNLAVLGYFKYANFFLANVSALTGRTFTPLHVALPLGISFFTFTQIAFLVDCYRGLARELDLTRYVLFVTFFPHLVAGPIVHHGQLMPQFSTALAKRWNPANVHPGLAFLTLGLFKKVVIADTCAPWAKAVFDSSAAPALLDAWRGALAYTMQLYFDFSGYSDMAIGLGLLFNVRLPDNFDAPYRAASIADFWRRWHITLSRFLRDYLYIPLGGSRRGETRRRVNVLVTMLLGGIWHGAGWTFALWGLYHGALLVIQRAWGLRHSPTPAALARPLTFLAVVIGWVLFRATSVDRAGAMVGGMVGLNGVGNAAHAAKWAALAALLVFVNVAPTTKQWVQTRELNAWRAIALGTLFFLSVMLMRTSLLTNTPSPFIYFQF
jgi:D-alanyl-lipoteichoic acid acyltransferase DltB (MBOAT superfamily)